LPGGGGGGGGGEGRVSTLRERLQCHFKSCSLTIDRLSMHSVMSDEGRFHVSRIP